MPSARPPRPARLARLSLAFTLAATAACGSSPGAPPRPLDAAPDPAVAARVDAALDAAIREQRIVGGVVLIARDGALIYHRAVGLADRERGTPMREDAIFRLASLSKPLTSVTALALVDQGKLGLDDEVTKFLPGFAPALADGSMPAITVRQLLTHTSGLNYGFYEPPDGPYHAAGVSDGLDAPGRSWADNERRLVTAGLRIPPGTAFRYSLSIDVLGEVVAHAGGAMLPDLVAHTITDPLAMRDTGFQVADLTRLVTPYANQSSGPPVAMTDGIALPLGTGLVTFAPTRILDPESYPSGGGGAAGTARDYLAFLEAVRTGSIGLQPDTRATLFHDQLAGADPAELNPGTTHGFISSIIEHPDQAGSPVSPGTLLWGGAYGHTWWIDTDARLAVVILTNTAFEGMFGQLVPDVQHAVYGR